MKKTTKLLLLIGLMGSALFMSSCDYVQTNNEGVLQTNYGRNGESDFTLVKGKVWTAMPGTELFNVPMNEQSGDLAPFDVFDKDASKFTIDPVYTYKPKRGRGIKIIFNYKNYQGGTMGFFESIEEILLEKWIDAIRNSENRIIITDGRTPVILSK